ncbi:hypothetical protein B0T20DRAFT_410854 [Sordaria brevicollis]|uniref:Uncharacterized protein n=1 Tax=Sordaria brevicollis TaxID=83679 RepID=A0AAE0PE89_SORBR|nr:hypothetical protein B0T20DRAFT_410854 [Sordaria brevicollis]
MGFLGTIILCGENPMLTLLLIHMGVGKVIMMVMVMMMTNRVTMVLFSHPPLFSLSRVLIQTDVQTRTRIKARMLDYLSERISGDADNTSYTGQSSVPFHTVLRGGKRFANDHELSCRCGATMPLFSPEKLSETHVEWLSARKSQDKTPCSCVGNH